MPALTRLLDEDKTFLRFCAERDVVERIAVDHQEIGERASFDNAEPSGIRISLAAQSHQSPVFGRRLLRQFRVRPSAPATRSSAQSNVQRRQRVRSADARRWASTHPMPLPHNVRSSTSVNTSSSVADRADGRALRCSKIFERLRSVPQAISPTTNACVNTWSSASSARSLEFPERRCSIQIDVSTRIITLRLAASGSGPVRARSRRGQPTVLPIRVR